MRQNVPVFALTNFGIQTFEIAEPVYPFLGEFDRRYISGHMGVIKPDAEIYAMVEADCGVPPEGLLFTDDRIDNINAAASRGWQTHLFEHPQGWADRLVRRRRFEQGGCTMTVMIPFEEGQKELDWLALTDALAAGHDGPKADVADVFLYEGDNTLLNRSAWIAGMGLAVKCATIFPGNKAAWQTCDRRGGEPVFRAGWRAGGDP